MTAVAAGLLVAVALPDGSALETSSETWLRPAARAVRVVGAVGVVGFGIVTVMLLGPGDDERLQRRASRAAGWGALAWAAGAVEELVAVWLSAAPVAGLAGVATVGFVDLATRTLLGLTMLVQLGLAVIAASCAFAARTSTPRILVLGCGMLGLAAGVAGGHAVDGPLHGVAVAAILAHVLAASAWTGGLAAMLSLLPHAAEQQRLLERYGAFALPCAISVGVTGVIAGTLMTDPARLLEARYGWLLLVKSAVFASVVGLGWRLRRAAAARGRSAAGGRTSVSRVAVAELSLMAFALGLSVVLSQSTPLVPAGDDAAAGALEPPTLASTLGALAPGTWGLIAVIGLAVPYLAGVLVLRRRGDAWPRRRAVPYLIGVVVLAAVTWTGVDLYASALMSVHMLQHMTINMIVPILLVLGAPVTLAFRALPPAPRARLRDATGSRLARIVAHPTLVSVVFVGSLFVVYFTPVFPFLMSDHWGHAVMLTHFLVSGFLFFWLVLGVDPDRHRPSGPIRIPLIAASTVGHTVFAVVLVFSTSVIGEAWFSTVDVAWDVSRRDDQALAGGIAWVVGELVMVGVLAVVIYRWFALAEKAGRTRR